MDKDAEISRLNERLEQRGKALEDLQARVEGIDANRRLSSLILTCEDFIASNPDEDIEEKAVQVIKRRLPNINISGADIQAAHRLQGKNKVIVRFVKRRLRDEIYESRFQLFSGTAEQRQRSTAPLYITESLTPSNRLIYSALLDARRPENGGKIASVFTRRGQVFCRLEKGGVNIRVPDWERLENILDGQRRSDPSAGPPATPERRGGPPPPRPAVGRGASRAPVVDRGPLSAPVADRRSASSLDPGLRPAPGSSPGSGASESPRREGLGDPSGPPAALASEPEAAPVGPSPSADPTTSMDQ
ncbi:hypothetical protein FJT64_011908 [Amphibalanus amphitrite]|uniref:Uncharacterized protein n=1 Tax=Amphibalanus amphitrite TaxID=1232801 RepID=A0A6A4VED3_AMPAM|nr:hypothetical protein FJT64_011908 [Amphibalanus amphitrite]